ncbi:CBS domain-containing protein [Haloarcula salina]|uniref:CBS domain-containing protein n=1 Tax=Haloarcula salina TaxID=1429914 RepID=A0AA41KKK6_9EURY|nr:CBS domain-containing protein [Haloarcula salina]MBV0903893.1 CBS domain-containing protein [Haloarcula salina]
MASEATVHIEDVMSTPLETISADETVRAAATQMREQDINGIFVPGAEAGIITTTDIVDAVAAGEDLSAATVADVMTAPVERVTASLELGEAAAMMTNFGIKHLPVIDEHQDYVGMVSSTDITRELA